MSKKIGDVAIALVVLLFTVGGISALMFGFDSGLGVTSSVTSDFNSFKSDLSDVDDLQNNFYDSIDNTTGTISDPSTDASEDTSSSGIINLFSKNILVRFVTGVAEKFNIPGIVISFILGLIGITITILLIRALVGDSKW